MTLSRLWPGRDAGSGGGGGGDPRAAAESRGIRRRQRRCHETLTPRGQSGMRAVGCGWGGGHRRVPGRDALVNSTAPGRPRPRSDGWGREAQTSPRSAGGARCSRPSGAEGGSAPLEPPSPPPPAPGSDLQIAGIARPLPLSHRRGVRRAPPVHPRAGRCVEPRLRSFPRAVLLPPPPSLGSGWPRFGGAPGEAGGWEREGGRPPPGARPPARRRGYVSGGRAELLRAALRRRVSGGLGEFSPSARFGTPGSRCTFCARSPFRSYFSIFGRVFSIAENIPGFVPAERRQRAALGGGAPGSALPAHSAERWVRRNGTVGADGRGLRAQLGLRERQLLPQAERILVQAK